MTSRTTDSFRSFRAGFSLIELLIVVAILSALVVFTVNGFNSISSSKGVTQAASDVVSLMEFARNEAVARQTFTWAAFKNVTNAGNPELRMMVIGSADGTTNANSTNLVSLSRVLQVRDCNLIDYSALSSETRGLFATNVVNLGTAGIKYSASSQNQFTDGATITFTPRGEALLKGSPDPKDGFIPFLGIGLQSSRGTKGDAGVILDGSTGIARIIRL